MQTLSKQADQSKEHAVNRFAHTAGIMNHAGMTGDKPAGKYTQTRGKV